MNTSSPSPVGYRLSPQQRHLWLLTRESSDRALPLRGMFRISGPLRRELLEKAVDRLLDRYEILRTALVPKTGMSLPVQTVLDPDAVKVQWFDHEPPGLESAGLALQPAKLDPERGPVARIAVYCGETGPVFLEMSFSGLCLDTASLGILGAALSREYAACQDGAPAEAEALQYVELAEWQHDILEDPESRDQVAFWPQAGIETRLDARPAFQMPVPAQSSETDSLGPGTCTLDLGDSWLDGLRRWSEAGGLPFQALLLAGWRVLLGFYTECWDLVVGVGYDGRNYPDLERAPGLLSRYLPAFEPAAPETPFGTLVAQTAAWARAAHDNQEYFSWGVIRNRAEMESEPGYSFLFDVAEGPWAWRCGEVLFHLVRIDRALEPGVKMRLTCTARPPGFRVNLAYERGLFHEGDVAAMLAGLLPVLRRGMARPETPVGALDLLEDATRQRLLHDFNKEPGPAPAVSSIHQWVASHAAVVPDRIAVTGTRGFLSFAGLRQRALRLSRYLRGRGVKPETRVALRLNRSLEMVVGVLGVFESGGAYVPIDPALPEARQMTMIRDAGAAVSLDSAAVRVGCRDSWTPSPTPESAVIFDADNLAYSIYTSGSSGRPKGVAVTHRALIHYVAGLCLRLQPPPASGFAMVSTFAADLGYTMLYPALCTGGTLHLPAEDALLDPVAFHRYLRARPIDYMKIVPGHFKALTTVEPERGAFPRRALILGGEASDAEWVGRLRKAAPHLAVFNHYGPSETIVGVSVYRSGASALERQRRWMPLGKPLPGSRLYVLSGHGWPVPEWLTGQLHIGGPGTARGYWQNPAMTAAAFLPDPFRGKPGGRMYRSGDLVRFLPGELLEFLGRADTQIKVRGFRVEVAEIEAVLERHPQVRAAAVVPDTESATEPRLVAHVACDAGLAQAVLEDYLVQELPAYMIPAVWMQCRALPRTANGKIDRRALPKPDRTRPNRAFTAPRDTRESVMAEVWAGVLGVDRVGIHDNFFELGGDSILGIQLVARLNRAGWRLLPRQIFKYPTIAGLAGYVRKAEHREEREAITGLIPLTPIQHRFFESGRIDAHHWNQALLLQPLHRLEPGPLHRALTALCIRHDVLRLRFQKGSGEILAVVDKAPSLPFHHVALDGAPAPIPAMERAAARIQASLDLFRGPLWRAVLFELGPGRGQRLLFVFHHLVVDGVSWRILLEELTAEVLAGLGNEAAPEFPISTSWARWTRVLNDAGAVSDFLGETAYWSEIASAARSLAPHPPEPGNAGAAASLVVALKAGETQALQREPVRAFHAGVDELLLAGLARVFGEVDGADRILVCLEGHGRHELWEDCDLSRTLGWFTVRYALPLPAKDGDPGSLLMRVKEAKRTVPRNGLGFGLLRYLHGDADLRRNLAYAEHAAVSFNYHGNLDRVLAENRLFRVAAEDPGPLRSERGKRMPPLEINAAVVEGRLELEWIYDRELHDTAEVASLAEAHLVAVRELIEHCARVTEPVFTPSDFSLNGVSQRQLDALLATGSGAVEDLYPLTPLQQGVLFHSLFSPDAPVYLVQKSYSLRGPLDHQALAQAWHRVAARHQVLRTCFAWDGLDAPLQKVYRAASVPWRVEDWSDPDREERDLRLEALLRADRERGFDLGTAPLLRICLVRWSSNEHRLITTHHQILMDGWSWVLVLAEVRALYREACRGRDFRVAEDLPTVRPFRDYIDWLGQHKPARAERFWRETLKGFAAPVSWLEPRAEPAKGDRDPYRRELLLLTRQETHELTQLTRVYKITLNTLVQGAWSLLIGHYAGERDVVFGAVVSGRPARLPGADSMVGLFINTLPVRVRAKPDAVPETWLREIQERQSESRDYEHTPLVEIQGWSELPHGVPLFDNVLVFENFPKDLNTAREGDPDLVSARYFELTHYPLTLAVGPGEAMSLMVVFDERRFQPTVVQRMLRHLHGLLAGFAADPPRLGQLSLLTPAEKHQILVEWDSVGLAPVPATLHGLFESWVARAPEAEALLWGETVWRYHDLDRRANRIAHYLLTGETGGSRAVGLMLGSGPDQVAAMLATLKSGAAFVCLDPDYPPVRLEQILVETRPGRILADAHGLHRHGALLDRFRKAAGTRIGLFGGDRESMQAPPAGVEIVDTEPFPGEKPEVSVEPENLAYMVFTSGSTGRPKGICHSHRNFCQFLSWQNPRYALGPGKRAALWASITYDASYCEIFGALGSGATLCMTDRDTRHDPAALIAWVRATRINLLILVPSFFRQVLELMEREPEQREGLSHWEILGLAGEALAAEPVRRWRLLFPQRPRMFNLYGPTECVLATCYPVPKEVPSAGVVTVGRAFSGRQVLILDDSGRPVPVGVRGEVYIRCPYLTDGYLGQPEASRIAFPPTPRGMDSVPVYRTGDRGRWFPDGTVDFLGRSDRQVKVRGIRVDLEEVEAALSGHGSVREGVVHLRILADGEQRLTAYVAAGGGLTAADLRLFLAERLPAVMVPLDFVFLSGLPRLPNGKIDRSSLAGLEVAPARGRDLTPPRNALEFRIAAIWTDLLGLDRLGVHDHFFELGGHSLSAARVVNRIRRDCGIALPLSALFDTPTVAGLAETAMRSRGVAENAAAPLLALVLEAKRRAGREPFNPQTHHRAKTPLVL